MKLNSLGSNLAALNNYEPPSGIAGKIIEDSIIGKAVEGIGEGLGVAGIFEDATKNIVKGLGVVTSPVTRLFSKEEHTENINDNVKDIQGSNQEAKKSES